MYIFFTFNMVHTEDVSYKQWWVSSRYFWPSVNQGIKYKIMVHLKVDFVVDL